MPQTRSKAKRNFVKRFAFTMTPVCPFRLDFTVWALRRRPENTIDCWDGTTFRRVLTIDGEPVEVEVQQEGQADHARLLVGAVARRITPQLKAKVKAALEKMLGLRCNLSPFYELARSIRGLAPLAEEFRGVKPPRFPTVFEALANGIACQQLSLLVGILLLSRLATKYGRTLGNYDNLVHAFPAPDDLAGVRSRSLRGLGFSGHKASFLLQLASAHRNRDLDLEQLSQYKNQVAVDWLQQLPGVGRWTAEYVLLRGLGRLDVFPGDDVGARNNLARFLGRRRPLDYGGVRRAVAEWQPYAGFIYFHFLLARVRDAGWMNASESKSPATQQTAA